MRSFLTILYFLFLVCLSATGQTKAKSYRLVFGSYTFQTETIIARDPVDKESTREYSYLFKNERHVIKIPRRIDTISVYSISDPTKGRIEIDTVDRIVVNKVVDTISKSQLDKIINSEIQIYSGSDKLKFDEAQFETIQANGKSSYTIDLQKTKIKDGTHAFEKVSSLGKDGYLILYTVWFYDLKNNKPDDADADDA